MNSEQMKIFDQKKELDDITKNFHKGNEFSVRANQDAAPKKKALRAQIYQAFVAAGPQGNTAEAVYQTLGIRAQTGSARCSELKRDGQLLRTSREGKTASGSWAQVLVADIYAAANPDVVPYVPRQRHP